MSDIVARAEKIRVDVERNLNNLSPAVRVMAGESLRPVLAMSELLLDLAQELENIKNGE